MPDQPKPLKFVRPGSRPAPDMVFSRVAVVGLGATGLSLGLAVRRTWPSALVIGVDSRERLERAIRLHAIDVGASDMGILAGAELVVLACRPGERLGWLERLPAHLEGEAVVTDVAGAKSQLLAPARALKRVAFVGGHLSLQPAGVTGAFDAVRLEAARWTLAPDPDDPKPEAVERLRRFAGALGAATRTMSPQDFDRLLDGTA